MRAVVACAILLSVAGAGCSEPPPDAPAGDEGGDRVSEAGSQKAGRSNVTRVLDHVVDWMPDASPAGTTMVVPANATSLVLHVSNVPVGPCGANWGDQDTPSSPHVDLTSPSGAVTQVDLLAQECSAGGAYLRTLIGSVDLRVEAGAWQVTLHGRGLDLQQHLVVEAGAA